MSTNKRYIGDGVYADFDGDRLILTTENGVSITNTIYLEEEVWLELQRYLKTLNSPTDMKGNRL